MMRSKLSALAIIFTLVFSSFTKPSFAQDNAELREKFKILFAGEGLYTLYFMLLMLDLDSAYSCFHAFENIERFYNTILSENFESPENSDPHLEILSKKAYENRNDLITNFVNLYKSIRNYIQEKRSESDEETFEFYDFRIFYALPTYIYQTGLRNMPFITLDNSDENPPSNEEELSTESEEDLSDNTKKDDKGKGKEERTAPSHKESSSDESSETPEDPRDEVSSFHSNDESPSSSSDNPGGESRKRKRPYGDVSTHQRSYYSNPAPRLSLAEEIPTPSKEDIKITLDGNSKLGGFTLQKTNPSSQEISYIRINIKLPKDSEKRNIFLKSSYLALSRLADYPNLSHTMIEIHLNLYKNDNEPTLNTFSLSEVERTLLEQLRNHPTNPLSLRNLNSLQISLTFNIHIQDIEDETYFFDNIYNSHFDFANDNLMRPLAAFLGFQDFYANSKLKTNTSRNKKIVSITRIFSFKKE